MWLLPGVATPFCFSSFDEAYGEVFYAGQDVEVRCSRFLGGLEVASSGFFGSYVGFYLYCVSNDWLLPLGSYRVYFTVVLCFFRVAHLTFTFQRDNTKL